MSSQSESSDPKAQLSFLKNLIFQNLMRNYLPFPMDMKLSSAWASGIRRGGDTVIYTSMMYQMAPLFRSYEKLIPTIRKIKGVYRFAALGKYFYKPSRDEINRSYAILRNIASSLSASGVSFGYLYEEEPYSGAILLELGMLDEFREYASKLMGFFRERGIRRLITVDPHTTNALHRMKQFHTMDIDVVNYLHLLRNVKGKGEYVLHDSCLYSRHLDMYQDIRNVIEKSGIHLKEDPIVTGKGTSMCCGFPVGIVDRILSERIAGLRAEKLSSVSENVMVLCPLCFQNLHERISNVVDFAEVFR
ncbi:MAG: (Fe-S)-binding protein [Thermoplasmata archaeon YP2-bin.285]|uniref:(Fe-S)-binding protein n=1 Tax=Candidatus Sysuiplasma superficiale TaxID=2823368 RepID=A0A8J8CAH6_9ARCH|nr:(Fe-S)-binding protein [Candidatus Sysuiplasma superficiale]